MICELSSRIGYEMSYDDPSKVLEEVARVTPSYGGISYDRIEKEGLHWPCPDSTHPGTPFLHKERFTRGRGLFHGIEYLPPDELRIRNIRISSRREEFTSTITPGQ